MYRKYLNLTQDTWSFSQPLPQSIRVHKHMNVCRGYKAATRFSAYHKQYYFEALSAVHSPPKLLLRINFMLVLYGNVLTWLMHSDAVVFLALSGHFVIQCENIVNSCK